MKEMPLDRKYASAIRSVDRAAIYVTAFMKQRLNERDFSAFRDGWNAGILPIGAENDLNKRYDLAYANWIRMARYTYSSVRARLGEHGITQFERAEIDAMTRSTERTTLLALGLLRKIAPRLAFKMVAKQLAYGMQWTTPLVVERLTGNELVVAVPQCKILSFEGTEELCSVGCQQTYRVWFAEQFGLNLETNLQGRGCKKILTLLR